jgi:hypothetical protein
MNRLHTKVWRRYEAELNKHEKIHYKTYKSDQRRINRLPFSFMISHIPFRVSKF